ncbi:MAG: methionine synthase [Methanobacteriota archaeon]|nr:MAG: methionine synthase [Euryarchaeota archaeon]
MSALLTTSVGSFPKPEYLTRARTKASKGELSSDGLRTLEEKATSEWIRFQEEIGIDILVDGEQYRGDMATYFAENLEGTEISGLVRSYGNRYYKKPIIVDELKRRGPISVDWFTFAQAQTERPVKGMITGPYTMMDWSFDEYYGSRADACLAFAKLLHEEAVALEAAGAKVVQVDEPALSTRFDELPLLVKAVGIVTKGLTAKTVLHTCYGNYNEIFDYFNQLPVDQLDLEMSNSGLDLLERFKREPLKKEIAFGVVDVHSHVIEPESLIRERIEKALTIFSPAKLYIDPDCGLKTRSVEEAQGKLRNMVAAARAVRKARGLT